MLDRDFYHLTWHTQNNWQFTFGIYEISIESTSLYHIRNEHFVLFNCSCWCRKIVTNLNGYWSLFMLILILSKYKPPNLLVDFVFRKPKTILSNHTFRFVSIFIILWTPKSHRRSPICPDIILCFFVFLFGLNWLNAVWFCIFSILELAILCVANIIFEFQFYVTFILFHKIM